jgi:hypothetical protein
MAVSLQGNPLRFNADFIEMRMREHRAWQAKQERALTTASVAEVVCALKLARVYSRGRTARRDERREPVNGPHPSI